jgi:serine/threonine protein kinase/Flp pilus assembly protein TadD
MRIPPRDDAGTRAGTCGPLGASARPEPGVSARIRAGAEGPVEELAAAWRRGERPGAEDVLARHPEIQGDAAVRLIYEEVCLRQEAGLEVDSAEVVRRFPQWRTELELVLDCHRLLQPQPSAAVDLEPGEVLGEFRLLAELGRGATGRTYLAAQSALADRPVVLKVTPRGHEEHLSLARLQHTHIVPLYAVADFPDRRLRALCMPFLGGATLARIGQILRDRPVDQRTGRDLLEALDRAQKDLPIALPVRGPFRQYLAQASYVSALCWIGACLAESLQYAHDRGLVHMDLKPSNVLLAGDGQPMLLDFHLAREPIRAGGPAPEWLGGTPESMSPEQRAAMAAVPDGRAVAAGVDGRTDIYALGLLLYEALGGRGPTAAAADGSTASRPRLERCNSRVSVGLADILHKCLAHEPGNRYPDAAAVALDLRRHLGDLPLRGVANRSLVERWRKWRRRLPARGRGRLGLAAVVAVVAAAAWLGGEARHHVLDLDPAATRWSSAGGARTGRSQAAAEAHAVRSAAESYERGRSWLRSGNLTRAAEELQRAVDLRPQALGPNLDLGVCAYRLRRFEEAVAAFSVCVALEPATAECYYNRAVSEEALGRVERARHDYTRALQLKPELSNAALNRGLLAHRAGRQADAVADLERALRTASDQALHGVIAFNLGLVHLTRHDRPAALSCLEQAVRAGHEEARELARRLERDGAGGGLTARIRRMGPVRDGVRAGAGLSSID